MAVYGRTLYGEDVYGLSLPPAYLLPSFTATSTDYETILLKWTTPTSGVMFQYRLLINHDGFPLNENDGLVMLDDTTWPGNQIAFKPAIPGRYHYFGFYVLADQDNNVWVRSGLTSVLHVDNFNSKKWMLDRLPEHFKTLPNGGALTDDAAGNTHLELFLGVLGFGADYLKTQANTLRRHMNDPRLMPIRDLYGLAGELGLRISPEQPGKIVRKAVANAAHVNRSRGTVLGILEEIETQTGYGADITIGPNMLLNDDQAQFLPNIYLGYSPAVQYDPGTVVQYPTAMATPFIERVCERLPVHVTIGSALSSGGNHPPKAFPKQQSVTVLSSHYTCWTFPAGGVRAGLSGAPYYQSGIGYLYKATGTVLGTEPPTDGTSNSAWTRVRDDDHDADDGTQLLKTPVVAGSSIASWELVDSSATYGLPPTGSMTVVSGISVPNVVLPAPSTVYQAGHGIRFYNKTGGARNYLVRSVGRTNSSLGSLSNPGFEGAVLAIVEASAVNPLSIGAAQMLWQNSGAQGTPGSPGRGGPFVERISIPVTGR